MVKTTADSRTEQTQIVLQAHANGSGRLFGGQLMAWMDVVGAVAARRHAGSEVVTAAVASMSFQTAARPNDIIVIDAHLTYAGRTSMEVCVTAQVEEIGGARREICSSHFVFVAIDWEGKPTPVPGLAPRDDEERREQERAAARRRQGER